MSETQNNPPIGDTKKTGEQIVDESGCASNDPPDDAGRDNSSSKSLDQNGIDHETNEAELCVFKRKLDELVANSCLKRAKQSALYNCEKGESEYNTPCDSTNTEQSKTNLNTSITEGEAAAFPGVRTAKQGALDNCEVAESDNNTPSDTTNTEQSKTNMNTRNTEGEEAASPGYINNALGNVMMCEETAPVDTQDPPSALAVNIKTEPVDTNDPALVTPAVVKVEPASQTQDAPSSLAVSIKTEPVDTNDAPLATAAVIKTEPEDDDNVASGSSNNQEADVKPPIRPSCKFGITCYRKNPIHRVQEAHPGDKDYRRPNYPPPPDGAPECPFGNNCYRRNPAHFQSHKHPTDTNFDWNYKIYRMQLRNRHPYVQYFNLGGLDLDSSDEDEEDPFGDIDLELDEDYDPDLDGDLDDDEGIDVN